MTSELPCLWLASYPRAGNSLLRMVLLPTYSTYGAEVWRKFPDLVGLDSQARAIKTHGLYERCFRKGDLAIHVLRPKHKCLESSLSRFGHDNYANTWEIHNG